MHAIFHLWFVYFVSNTIIRSVRYCSQYARYVQVSNVVMWQKFTTKTVNIWAKAVIFVRGFDQGQKKLIGHTPFWLTWKAASHKSWRWRSQQATTCRLIQLVACVHYEWHLQDGGQGYCISECLQGKGRWAGQQLGAQLRIQAPQVSWLYRMHKLVSSNMFLLL